MQTLPSPVQKGHPMTATPNTAAQQNEKLIKDADAEQRRAIMSAMKTTGWKRRVHLWFASVFGKISDEMQDIEAQRKRGKDDGYHDEY